MGALYRIRQGLANLSARMDPEDWTLVDRYLSGPERKLFEGMEPADQRHSVLVLRTLLGVGAVEENLLKAALLHDVGKSRCRISTLHRTLAVLIVALFGRLPGFPPEASEIGRWMPFHVLVNHPRIGASMLARAGSNERVWRLVELHQLKPDRVGPIPDGEWMRRALAALRRADNQN